MPQVRHALARQWITRSSVRFCKLLREESEATREGKTIRPASSAVAGEFGCRRCPPSEPFDPPPLRFPKIAIQLGPGSSAISYAAEKGISIEECWRERASADLSATQSRFANGCLPIPELFALYHTIC
ncbi:hypothetical protein PHSY_001935 [Pseudozyma hubeiensis SY62]|uniref:Uncharacterized protein n=1 Tax=Pseudozyma hubeiensis (strain SY62) TaxID=1305764 RepID=R9NZZ3_PSEHS|nr:hypothetical protein PHSY_001935 [Pseudozyma hubeiensis SY62]GAC94364.1 hypothetical protein PHSY_001935 [Pseudozyma hubeiensis SY62]